MVNWRNDISRIERVDHPIAILPDGALAIFLVAVGVRVTREVEPRARPPLSVARRAQQAIDERVVSVGTRVRDERIDLFEARR